MSTIRYRSKVKFRISFEHEMEVDTDNPNEAGDSARDALEHDSFIKENNAKLELLSMESHILDESANK